MFMNLNWSSITIAWNKFWKWTGWTGVGAMTQLLLSIAAFITIFYTLKKDNEYLKYDIVFSDEIGNSEFIKYLDTDSSSLHSIVDNIVIPENIMMYHIYSYSYWSPNYCIRLTNRGQSSIYIEEIFLNVNDKEVLFFTNNDQEFVKLESGQIKNFYYSNIEEIKRWKNDRYFNVDEKFKVRIKLTKGNIFEFVSDYSYASFLLRIDREENILKSDNDSTYKGTIERLKMDIIYFNEIEKNDTFKNLDSIN